MWISCNRLNSDNENADGSTGIDHNLSSLRSSHCSTEESDDCNDVSLLCKGGIQHSRKHENT